MRDLKMAPDSASAIVELTVEVKTAAWGVDSTIDQAVTQATREATAKLERIFSEDRAIRVLGAKAVRVVCSAKKE